jgi:[acyl-carrier-protein] S-malonyltransferase
MAAASAAEPTGMTAVLGGDTEAVLAAIAGRGLTPANVNGAGQIVAAGTIADLEAFAADPPAGARLRPLQVAGAFHTRHMAPAVAALREAVAGVTVEDPVITLLSDADGAAVTTGMEWLERIVAQVAAPVRVARRDTEAAPRRPRPARPKAAPGRLPRGEPPPASAEGF